MSLERITIDEAVALLGLPRTLGHDPADGEPILASNGRYGPYVQKGKDYRSIDDEDRLLTITLDEALHVLAQPKVYRRGAAQNMAAKGPLREFGPDPASGRPVVAKDGRFGVYVTDGETNASIGRGDRIEAMEAERAFELLAIRREQVAAKGGTGGAGTAGTKRGGAKRAAKKPAKSASAKRAAPRKG
jgi:DNA topoisomerase-1